MKSSEGNRNNVPYTNSYGVELVLSLYENIAQVG